MKKMGNDPAGIYSGGMNSQNRYVAVLGASPKPERYSNQAVRLLLEHGYDVLPVHPAMEEVEGLRVYKNLPAIALPVDTVTVYLSPQHSTPLTQALIALNPRRVIFNPGAENPALQSALAGAGIAVEEACTLVLLRTGQF